MTMRITSQKHKSQNFHSTYKRKDALSRIAVVGTELEKILLVLGEIQAQETKDTFALSISQSISQLVKETGTHLKIVGRWVAEIEAWCCRVGEIERRLVLNSLNQAALSAELERRLKWQERKSSEI